MDIFYGFIAGFIIGIIATIFFNRRRKSHTSESLKGKIDTNYNDLRSAVDRDREQLDREREAVGRARTNLVKEKRLNDAERERLSRERENLDRDRESYKITRESISRIISTPEGSE